MKRRQIPFFNYTAITRRFQEELVSIFRDVLSRGAFILQKDLISFEVQAGSYIKSKYFLGVADGTNALILALRAARIGPGDEVIVPSHTYIASAAAIHFVGAVPVLVDCGTDHLIDPESALNAITSRTRAMMPVHLNGRVCDMDRLQQIARKHDLAVIEDAAQAFGARLGSTYAGSFGLAGTFSFYPAKVLGCFGDGGGIATQDEGVYEFLFQHRDHGRSQDGQVLSWGTNCRLDNLQAAFLSLLLAHLDQNILLRRKIAAIYNKGLGSIEDLVLPPPPCESNERLDTFQNYEIESSRRNELMKYLSDHGVATTIQWGGKAVHQFPHVQSRYHLPRTEKLFQRCFLLPMNHTLSEDDAHYVVDQIKKFYSK